MNDNSVTYLVKIWLDMMRPITHHLVDENSEQWSPSLGYCDTIRNIEKAIKEKLEISIVEVIVILLNKKKIQDLKERNLLKKKF